ncbi:MAG: Nif3-like dinuclear metal center hexameric protein [Caldiserica bacterium]|nr:Nif3-like dinuclear metal center hexameric protein [Caldisericota bacterium]
MKLREIVQYLDEILKVKEIPDNSKNGLQVENTGDVHRIGIAVDACRECFEEARKRKVDFLLVHHGLFWKEMTPITGNLYQRVKILMEGNIALYAAHLPLDVHAEWGNNAVALDILGWDKGIPFGDYHGVNLGYEFSLPRPWEKQEIKEWVEKKLHTQAISWDFGVEKIRKGAFISGSALALLPQAIERKLDIFITGEPFHTWYWQAKEAKINVLFAGHHKTEILGVREVGRHLSKKFELPLEILDLPTGL